MVRGPQTLGHIVYVTLGKILSVLIPFWKREPAHLYILRLLFKKFHDYQSSAYWFSFRLGAEMDKEVNSDADISSFTSHKPYFKL